MVKVKQRKVSALAEEEILKGVVSDAIKVKNALDTIGCYVVPSDVNDDALSRIQFKYRYGLQTANWKIDEKRFAKIPFVALTKLDLSTSPAFVLNTAAPPPPSRGFKRRDGTLIVVTATGNIYPKNLELRLPVGTMMKSKTGKATNHLNANTNARTVKKTNGKGTEVPPTKTTVSTGVSAADEYRSIEYDDGGGEDYSFEPVETNINVANQTNDYVADRTNDNVANQTNDYDDTNRDHFDDERDQDEGVSSWDEESDEELVGPPPQGIDTSKVELLQSCPYCNLSFVGENGRILYAILSRITSGNEAEYVEEHMDRCCLRQHMGQLMQCTECDKSYYNIPQKETRHWNKYHRHDLRICPFEQCSNVALRSDAALTQHLTSAHYWKSAKSKSYVASMKKKSVKSEH